MNAPRDGIYSYTEDPDPSKTPTEVMIGFEQGVPVSIDGVRKTPIEMVREMNTLAGAQGVGRIDMVEDRLVGIKSREIYEAPAAIALIEAHEHLEDMTLERDVLRMKRQLEAEWSNLVYDGLWFGGLKQSIDAFIDHTQQYVTGEVRLQLHNGRATVTGRRSAQSLYDFELATYETGDQFDQSHAKGFIELWSMPSKIAARRAQGQK